MEVSQEIMYQGKPVGKPFTDKGSRKSGSYGVSYSTKIPAKAQEGKYTLKTTVQTANAKDERTCEFSIAKKAASNQVEIHMASLGAYLGNF